jgi:hypothetical protein
MAEWLPVLDSLVTDPEYNILEISLLFQGGHHL